MIRNVIGIPLFLGGLAAMGVARSWGTRGKNIDRRQARQRGDVDWRWGIPGLASTLAGILLIQF
jgi:hypothetical protein